MLDSAIQRLVDLKDDTGFSLRHENSRLHWLAEAYQLKGDFEQALLALQAQNKVSNQISSENTLGQVELIEEAFRDRERELELVAAEAELSLQVSNANATNRIRNLVCMAALILTLMTFFGFWLSLIHISEPTRPY